LPTRRILVDESLPVELAEELRLPDVKTVRALGWSGLKNGALIQRAISSGFSVFLTADQSLGYQQNIASLEIAVIVLRGRNRIQDLRPLIPAIHSTLSVISPGQLMRLGS
jgi:rRNA-processing protein FCF1